MNTIWNSALNSLARREHSSAELRSKLLRRFPEQENDIEAVLQRLVDAGLQSDERFTEMWLRSQVARNRGPMRIRAEARQKGIESLIEAAMQEADVDWFELASETLQRKFKAGLSFDDKPKAYRFLAYRGFDGDSIRYALEQVSDH